MVIIAGKKLFSLGNVNHNSVCVHHVSGAQYIQQVSRIDVLPVAGNISIDVCATSSQASTSHICWCYQAGNAWRCCPTTRLKKAPKLIYKTVIKLINWYRHSDWENKLCDIESNHSSLNFTCTPTIRCQRERKAERDAEEPDENNPHKISWELLLRNIPLGIW